MRISKALLLFSFFLLYFKVSFAQASRDKSLISYVNPFIGTGGHGHTYPGASLPFGMVQLSPDNLTEGWDWSSGYHYSDSTIAGFSHTHLSGTGIGDLYDISVMPMANMKIDSLPVFSSFNHKNEQASPGYYRVFLNDFNINVELTATERCGFHQYTFPKTQNAAIRLDLGFKKNWDWVIENSFQQINDTTFVGYRYSGGWANYQRVYFAILLSKPVSRVTILKDKKEITATQAKAKDIKAYLQFSTLTDERVLMKVGLSMANIEGALESLKEVKHWDFNAVKNLAESKWEKQLSKVLIASKEDSVKTIFYTALYRTYLAPTLFTDAHHNYKGVDGKVHNSSGLPIYTTHSLWDVFRAANPLLTLTQPQMVPDIINSYLSFYDQYGALPIWDLHFNETGTMTGYHAIPIITDAILKNIKGFDINKAYVAMKKSSMQNIRATNYYRTYKYIPYDKANESVTSTLEYAYDDWCIAQVAKKLNDTTANSYYLRRAAYYKNLFDKNTGFFRPKLADGTWKSPFDPLSAGGEKNPYLEGNAWQYNFFVPHDIVGLQNLYPNNQGLELKIDSLFNTTNELTGAHVSDITGLIGQYAHGNEPSHHIAYMYNYLGKPWKTAEKVRKIITTQYQNSPNGLSGNEDCGQMSAWYIFTALGFYPVNPANGEYVFGSPLIDEATINLPNHKKFKITVLNNSAENIYIQSVTINHKKYLSTFINHSTIINGGNMKIVMGKQPNFNWGVNNTSRPSSMSNTK